MNSHAAHACSVDLCHYTSTMAVFKSKTPYQLPLDTAFFVNQVGVKAYTCLLTPADSTETRSGGNRVGFTWVVRAG